MTYEEYEELSEEVQREIYNDYLDCDPDDISIPWDQFLETYPIPSYEEQQAMTKHYDDRESGRLL